MSVRTIKECDRCGHEIHAGDKIDLVSINGKEYELHESCGSKVQRILDNEDVETPP